MLYERHEIDLAAVEGAWAHQAGYCTVSIKFTHKPKPKVFMLEQSDDSPVEENSSPQFSRSAFVATPSGTPKSDHQV